MADLTRWFAWGPEDASRLTGSKLVWWVEQANRMAKEEAERRNGR
jgi:hypothetical protein